VPLELAARLSRHCAAAHVTESAAVEAALREYLDESSDRTLILARLDRLGRAQERTQRDQSAHAEAFATFVKIWFAQTPSIPEDARKAAQSTADARFRQFIECVVAQLSSGAGFIDQLPQEPLTDDEGTSDPSGDASSDGGLKGTSAKPGTTP
jgi:hypothetical protein